MKQLVLEADLRLQELGGHTFANNASGAAALGAGLAGHSNYLLFNNLHNAGTMVGVGAMAGAAGAGHSRSSSISGLAASNGTAFATPSLSVSNADAVSVSSTSSSSDKQLSIWERRVKSLKRMLLGFEQSSKHVVECYPHYDIVRL